MSLFLEKCNDALNRSAFYFTEGSIWSLWLVKKYWKLITTGPNRNDDATIKMHCFTFGTVAIIEYVLIPIIIGLIPFTINIAFNLTASLVNFILSPIIVPALTLIHMAKSACRQGIVDVIGKMEPTTFDLACEKIRKYSPQSAVSKEFKKNFEQISAENREGLISKKAAANVFFKSSGSYNTGRNISTCFFSAAADKVKADKEKSLNDNKSSLLANEISRLETLQL